LLKARFLRFINIQTNKTTMKKLHALLLALLPVAALAQQDTPAIDAPHLLFGFNVGGTYVGLHGNSASGENNSTIDYLVGVSLEVPLNNNFSLVGNVNYERLAFTRNLPFGSAGDADASDGYGTRLILKNITVPVNVKYYIGQSKSYYVNGGAFVRYFLDDTTRINGERVEGASYGNFQDLTYGLDLGLGMHFVVNENDAITIELRDNLGLSNITKQTAAGANSVKTNSVNLILSYQFGF
jgi:Outer membrane protein beta-barrel domain